MAKVYNLHVDQGTRFELDVTVTQVDVDLTEYTPRAYMAKHPHSNNKIAFTTSYASNTLTLTLLPSATANLEAGKYVYDAIFINNSNNIIRVLEGTVFVNPMISPIT